MTGNYRSNQPRNKKGGVGARNRRRLSRLHKRRRGTPQPYGPIVKYPIRYFGTFNIDSRSDIKSDGWLSKHIAIGNRQLFSAETSALGKLYHEYKITGASIKLTFSQYRTAQWSFKTSPDSVSATVVSFLRDQESPYTTQKAVSFDSVCSEPGCRVSHLPPGGKASTLHYWRPTEPQDRDWRTTDNDGLCHLYVGWRLDDLIEDSHVGCMVMVEITTNVHLRGYNLGAFSVCLSDGPPAEKPVSPTPSPPYSPHSPPSPPAMSVESLEIVEHTDASPTCAQLPALSTLTIVDSDKEQSETLAPATDS